MTVSVVCCQHVRNEKQHCLCNAFHAISLVQLLFFFFFSFFALAVNLLHSGCSWLGCYSFPLRSPHADEHYILLFILVSVIVLSPPLSHEWFVAQLRTFFCVYSKLSKSKICFPSLISVFHAYCFLIWSLPIHQVYNYGFNCDGLPCLCLDPCIEFWKQFLEYL